MNPRNPPSHPIANLYPQKDVDAYTRDEIDALFADYYSKADIDAGFYTSAAVDALFENYYTAAEVDAALADYYTAAEVNAGFYTKAEVDSALSLKTNRSHIITDGSNSGVEIWDRVTNFDNAWQWYATGGALRLWDHHDGVNRLQLDAVGVLPGVDLGGWLGKNSQRWEYAHVQNFVAYRAYYLLANDDAYKPGSLYRHSQYGFVMVPTAGTQLDFLLTNGSGQTVFVVPAGTQVARFYNNVEWVSDNAYDFGGASTAAGHRPRNAYIGTAVYVGPTKVLGPRITGWGLPDTTLSRSSYVTTSVTLLELAKRVTALITDLRAHGIIGS